MKPTWLIPVIAIGTACYVVWIITSSLVIILGGIHA